MSETDGVQARDAIAEPMARGSEAFARGDLHDALTAWREAARSLRSDENDVAILVFENIGLAAYNLGYYSEASRAFLRALDGQPTSREQSLRLVIAALYRLGQRGNATSLLAIYEHTFGTHPHGYARDP